MLWDLILSSSFWQVVATSAVVKPHAKMHDFCMTIPYGFIVALGGVMGAVMKGTYRKEILLPSSAALPQPLAARSHSLI
jgi:hypothetical protein